MPQRRRTPMPWRRSRRKRRLPSDLIILVSKTPATIEAGIAHCADKKPLIYAATAENADAMAKIAKEKKASLRSDHPCEQNPGNHRSRHCALCRQETSDLCRNGGERRCHGEDREGKEGFPPI